jgi:hypothetical protein
MAEWVTIQESSAGDWCGDEVALWAVAGDCDSAVEGYYSEKDLAQECVYSGMSFMEKREHS